MPQTSRQTPSPPDPLEIPRRRPLGSPLNLLLGVLAVAVLVVAAVTLLGGNDPVAVPDLVGLTVAEAQTRVEDAGLALSVPEGAPPGSADARVAGQDPAPGASAQEGDTVYASLVPEVAQTTVPDLRGLAADSARQSLTEADLVAGALLSDASAQAPAGIVTRQEPEPGALVPSGSSVALWIASGAKTRVPDLTGLTQTEAEARATSAGLVLQVLREVTDEVLPGLVFRQSPEPGEQVVPGAPVVVVVNNAPGADTTATTSPGDTGTAAAGAAPAPYGALAAAFPFPVLYPATLPATFTLDPGPGNPRQLTDQAGNLAFEVRYVDPTRPDVRLSLIEGGLFELGFDEATTVDVRGFPGSLGTGGESVVLTWQEGGTPYMITAEGLAPSEVVAFASTMVPAKTR